MGDEDVRAEARLVAMQEVFETAGWNTVVDDLEFELTQIERAILEASNWDEVVYLRGKRDFAQQVIHLEDTVANLLQVEGNR